MTCNLTPERLLAGPDDQVLGPASSEPCGITDKAELRAGCFAGTLCGVDRVTSQVVQLRKRCTSRDYSGLLDAGGRADRLLCCAALQILAMMVSVVR